MSDQFNKPKKCKCCHMVVSKSFRNIFDEEGVELNIEFLLLECLGKKVFKKNGLDQVICTKCLLQLQQSYEFKKMCMEARDDSDDENSEENEVAIKNSIETEEKCDEQIADIEKLDEEFHEEYITDEPSELTYEIIEMSPEEHNENEIKYVELIDFRGSSSSLDEKLSTTLTLPTVRKKFTKNVNNKIKPSRTVDVRQIRTPDDLTHILEDESHRKNDSNRKHPTETEYLDESRPIELNDYVKLVTLTSYDEGKLFTTEVRCGICGDNDDVQLECFSDIIKHMCSSHLEDQFACLLRSECGSFGDFKELKQHYASDHQDILTPLVKLKCPTCDIIFESPIKFGKHICHNDYQIKDSEKNFKCSLCHKQLTSRKRLSFHKQFHIPNQRPKFCLVCQITYQDESSFYEHVMFAHEKVFEHFCQLCDKSFSTELDLLRHENAHLAPRNYTCVECGKKFIDKQTWNEHSVVHLPVKPLQCDICNKSYTRKSRLQKHMKSHTIFKASELVQCEICNAIFTDDEEAMEHCQDVHDADSDEILLGYGTFDKVFACEFCELCFGTPESVFVHRDTHKGDLKFECSFCDSKYDTYSKLRTHILIHKTQMKSYPVARHYVCDQDNCFKSYIHWSSLTAHRKTSHLINPSIIKCPECPETFYRSWTYDYHKKTVHDEGQSCPICGKGFYKKKSLEMHMQRVHIDDKKRSSVTIKMEAAEAMIEEVDGIVSCTECGKTCLSKHNAISHVSMVHLKVRNFACDICDKKFYQKGDLNDHRRLHTKEKPFQCQFCSYSSRKRSMMVAHERSHTNERPFQCPRCPCAFKRSYVLRNHLKYHDGVKEFQCAIETCGRMFTTKAALNFHCKKHNDTGAEPQVTDDNIVLSKSKLATLQTTRVPVKRAIKRKIPKIVYVMPGNVESEPETRLSKKR